jgi:hypothetical protein
MVEQQQKKKKEKKKKKTKKKEKLKKKKRQKRIHFSSQLIFIVLISAGDTTKTEIFLEQRENSSFRIFFSLFFFQFTSTLSPSTLCEAVSHTLARLREAPDTEIFNGWARDWKKKKKKEKKKKKKRTKKKARLKKQCVG